MCLSGFGRGKEGLVFLFGTLEEREFCSFHFLCFFVYVHEHELICGWRCGWVCVCVLWCCVGFALCVCASMCVRLFVWWSVGVLFVLFVVFVCVCVCVGVELQM